MEGTIQEVCQQRIVSVKEKYVFEANVLYSQKQDVVFANLILVNKPSSIKSRP